MFSRKLQDRRRRRRRDPEISASLGARRTPTARSSNPGGGGPAHVLGAGPDRSPLDDYLRGRTTWRSPSHRSMAFMAPPPRPTDSCSSPGWARSSNDPDAGARRGDPAPLPRLGGGVPPQDHPRVQGSPARVLVHDAAGPQGIAQGGKQCPRRVDRGVQPAARARRGRRSGGGTDRQEPRRVADRLDQGEYALVDLQEADRRSHAEPRPERLSEYEKRRRIMSQVMPERRPPARAERSPFADLDQLGERMRRMLEQTFGDFARRSPSQSAGFLPSTSRSRTTPTWSRPRSRASSART